jgi:hypothetical protein
MASTVDYQLERRGEISGQMAKLMSSFVVQGERQ